ncbi:MAG: class I SAM-dependent methyltransferase [Phycisphaerae bacterium]|jgi:2-polyprenyl-3-methyl-5-hydroxy-6-metoxy-1,4-benzoquinol methylase
MTTLSAPPIDERKSSAFAEKMLGVINDGAVALMTSIGHRTGLFDRLADLPPSSSAEIAEAAGLNERYVREWLGAMVTGGVIEHEPSTNTFVLPPEHAKWVTRSAGVDNMASTTQWVAVMASVEDHITDCFKHGGGAQYCQYHRFHEVMAEESGGTVVDALFDHILPLEPGLTNRLDEGIDVLDVGCGAGRAMNMLAERFPASRFTGFDLCPDAVEAARDEAKRHGSKNIRFEATDVARLNGARTFDLVTAFDAIHDQADPAGVLSGIHRALNPEGLFLMQDIAASSHLHKNMDHPIGPFLYTISTTHCMSVSLAQGGAGLGTVWGEELARDMLAEAGFDDVEVKQLPHDMINSYYLARRRGKRAR